MPQLWAGLSPSPGRTRTASRCYKGGGKATPLLLCQRSRTPSRGTRSQPGNGHGVHHHQEQAGERSAGTPSPGREKDLHPCKRVDYITMLSAAHILIYFSNRFIRPRIRAFPNPRPQLECGTIVYNLCFVYNVNLCKCSVNKHFRNS